MADILVRGLDAKTVARLKEQAKRNGRSLQREAKLVLEQAASYTLQEALASARRWQRTLRGRRVADNAALVREDRSR